MNLIDSFEPMQIPTNGLARVRRDARGRAIKHKLLTGGAALALPVIMAVSFASLNSDDFGSSDSGTDDSPPTITVPTTQTTQTSPTTSNPNPITKGDVQFSVKPDPGGLPGSSSSVVLWQGCLFFASVFAYLMMLLAVTAAVIESVRSKTPILRFSKVEKWMIALGLILPTCLFVLDWLFSAGN